MSNDKNREAFEAFAISQYKNISLEREADGDYVRSLAYTQWMFWQASRKQALKDAAAACKAADLLAYANGSRLTLTCANHIIESLK